MSATTCQAAAHHEGGHATALAVRTKILTNNIYVGCKSDGTSLAGINDARRIPVTEIGVADWMIYNLAGHVAERIFDPNANRHTALRDDITAEKLLRFSFHRELWAEILDMAEQLTEGLVHAHWTCIQQLADAILTEPSRAVVFQGEECHVHRLSSPKIAEVLHDNGIQASKLFGSEDPDAMFEKLLERSVASSRLAEESVLATEFRNWRRFSEMKFPHPTAPVLDHKMWLDYFGTSSPSIL